MTVHACMCIILQFSSSVKPKYKLFLMQVDPRTLDLADFSCREVTVRFAVANLNGLSGFSGSVRIPQVYGGEIGKFVHSTVHLLPYSFSNKKKINKKKYIYIKHIFLATIEFKHKNLSFLVLVTLSTSAQKV